MSTLNIEGEVYLGNKFSESSFKLLELPSDLELVEGMELVIKGVENRSPDGSETGSAVICTNNATYALRKAETSNTQLLLPLQPLPKPICEEENAQNGGREKNIVISGMADHHFELVRIAPRTETLEKVLLESALEREHCDVPEELLGHLGFEMRQLLRRVQASESEVKKALVDLGAFQIRSKWVLVRPDVENEVFQLILATVIQYGMDASSVRFASLVSELEGEFTPFILTQTLRAFKSEEMHESDGVYWRLCPETVARFRAKTVLEASRRIAKESFMSEWSRLLPRGVNPDITYLKGLVAELQVGGLDLVELFPASDLPGSPKECFAALFALKPKWKLEEIDPFIKHLLGPSVRKADLLRKYTRSVRVSIESQERVLVTR